MYTRIFLILLNKFRLRFVQYLRLEVHLQVTHLHFLIRILLTKTFILFNPGNIFNRHRPNLHLIFSEKI